MTATPNKRVVLINSWILLSLLCAVKPQDLTEGLSYNELDSLVEKLFNPNSNYELHASALRNQLKQIVNKNNGLDYDDSFIDEKNFLPKNDDINLFRRRYLESLLKAGLGLTYNEKRNLATLARNGQLPTPESNSADLWTEKRNLASLARSGNYLNTGKRNVGSLARDFQLPTNGKRFLSNLARFSLIPSSDNNDNYLAYVDQKRNLGALKGSPVHGILQKKNKSTYYSVQPDYNDVAVNGMNAFDLAEEKRFLGRILPPTRTTTTTHRSRL